MDETLQLVRYLSGLSFDELPSDVIATAKLCLLDAIGVGLFASTAPWTVIGAEMVRETGGRPESVVWGRGFRSSARDASFVNGLAVHGIELDDRYPKLQLHPGAQIIPSALSATERSHSSGRQLLLGIIAGYEVIFRVANCVPQLKRGLTGPMHKGVWGSTAAASKALALSEEQTLNAFGIAGSMASGHNAYVDDSAHAMVKRLYGAWPALSGMTAALLAQRGFEGPWSVLEGQHGYCSVFGSDEDPNFQKLVEGLGCSFQISRREVKPYATWGNAHVVIEAVNTILARCKTDTTKVDSITVGCSSNLMNLKRMERRPKSLAAAQGSLPFIVAMAMLCDLRDPRVWCDEVLADERVLALADRVITVQDPRREQVYRTTGDNGGAAVDVVLSTGEHQTSDITYSKGTEQNPMTEAEIKEKFSILARVALRGDDISALLDMVATLEDLADVNALTDVLIGESQG